MCESQSKEFNLLHPPVEQFPLLPHPLGVEELPTEQFEHPI